MSIPSHQETQRIEALKHTLIQRAKDARCTIQIHDLQPSSDVVKFFDAFWLVKLEVRKKKNWFGKEISQKQYTFDIDFKTLFLSPGKLILHHDQHPSSDIFKSKDIDVEPVLIQW